MRKRTLRELTTTMVGGAALAAGALLPLQAASTLVVNPDGITVNDTVNKVNWLADANLPASNRFGLPVCSSSSIDTKRCVNPSGSMSYQAAAAWVIRLRVLWPASFSPSAES